MLKMIRDRVAISPIFDPDTTPSGRIIIPDQAKERCDQGIVKYIGPEVKEVKIGDFVIFGNYDGSVMKIEDEGLLIMMDEAAIKAIVGVNEEYFSSTEVPGLYFRGSNGVYFQATYEQAHSLIADAIKNAPWHAGWRIRTEKPDPKEYERAAGLRR